MTEFRALSDLGSAAAPASAQPKLTGSISTDTARLNSRENLQAAGERFEAIFTKMMLGSMRKAKLADSLFESQALDQFRDMQDDKLAQNMATHAPIGIGKAMTEFLARANGLAGSNPPPPGGGVSQGLTEGAGTTSGVGETSPSVALRAPPPPGGGGLRLTREGNAR